MLTMIIIALITGVLSQLIAVRVGLPSIVFLLILGVFVGPEFFNLVDPHEFGEGLETIIKLCVAIILFEAGLNLDKDEIKSHSKVVTPLITIGVVITMIGGAIFSHLFAGLSWDHAFLYGSLVIVTGPTVIQPLLKRIKIKPNLKNILEFEGVFIDPIGAIVAIFVFEIVIHEHKGVDKSFVLVLYRFLIGGIIGAVGGYLLSKTVKKLYFYMEDLIDLFVLVIALGIYALSEYIIVESGLMAAIVSGIIVGNLNVPEEENLKKFKGKLTTLVISLLFILLAANLKLKYITDLGFSGVLVVISLLFVVRPVQIFISTIRSSLDLKEKLFLSYISPRGIIAASIASLISIELNKRGMAGGDEVQGLVFLTIAMSVILQGSTAKHVSRALNVTYKVNRVVVVGANNFARLMAKLLILKKVDVCLIDTNPRLVELARSEGLEVVEGNSLDVDQLEETGISISDSIVSITTSDKVNTFVCRLAKIDFGIKNVFPVLNNFADVMDIESIKKLGLQIAFGKKLNLFEIYSKIDSKQYVIFEFEVGKEISSKSIDQLEMSSHLIPLLIQKQKTSGIEIYHEEIILEKGDMVTMLDVEPFNTEIAILKDLKKNIIEV